MGGAAGAAGLFYSLLYFIYIIFFIFQKKIKEFTCGTCGTNRLEGKRQDYVYLGYEIIKRLVPLLPFPLECILN